MNRRSFLLGLGMMACSGSAATPPQRPRKSSRKPTPDEPPSGGVVDTALLESQLRASPLAFSGDTLVQSFGGELRSWDATSMKRTDTWALPHRHFCFVQDGSLVAFGWPTKGDSRSVFHRVANGKVQSQKGPLVPSSNSIVLLPARNPNELYVVGQDEDIYRLTTVEVEEILKHPYPSGATRDQWVSRGDGRLIGGRNGALYAIGPKTASTQYPIADRDLKHLVAATGERVWYSYAERNEDWNAHTLVLAPATTPMMHLHKIDVAPMRVVHLASFHDTVVALLMVMGQTRADLHWKVGVFDETGKERWRADVPDGFGPGAALNNGFVAIGEHRVVLASASGELLAWDESGKPIEDRR